MDIKQFVILWLKVIAIGIVIVFVLPYCVFAVGSLSIPALPSFYAMMPLIRVFIFLTFCIAAFVYYVD